MQPIMSSVDGFLPAWAWVLLEDYVERTLERGGNPAPTGHDTLVQLGRLWPDLTCTILVQEPWMGTIRFKRLARLRGDAMRPFLDDPEGFLRERFGGGKFKINLHHGMHFVSTKNFKPSGPSRWAGLPEVAEE